MTPQEFIAKWRGVELKERTASQSHFNDLCRLLGVEDPISADKTGEWFTFEKGASKTSGGEGWADVWRKGCFAWEYKGRAANLDKAFDQLLRYSIALESPPLLVVSDMDRIRIHTNWTNTVQQVHEITLEELADAAKRDLLRACFDDPERLRPTKTRQMLTEDAAKEFAALAQRLRSRDHEAHTVAHFVNRLVFCMFAEDVGLLPGAMFSRMLEASRTQPADFQALAKTLFAAMRTGGMVGFEKVDWFNGGLFDDDEALPLEADDVEALIKAAKLDWSEIDPSILGTLFERGLDPSKRSQLGAHYTDREKIMMIVRPVIIEPLEREWADVKAAIETAVAKAADAKAGAKTKALGDASRLMAQWRERLWAFRVLDPACGSGNFLYLSLLALKDIEHRTNLEAEQLGLPREFPRVGPENVLGIELNPYAAELARVSVWIGEIQWMRRNGFDAARDPILRPLATIECRDALIQADGSVASWPVAEVIIGNPPFAGDKKLAELFDENYLAALRKAYRGTVAPSANFVAYWFYKSGQALQAVTKRFGLVSTQAIRRGASRRVLKAVLDNGNAIFEAWSNEPWAQDGAQVRVSLVCVSREHAIERPILDGEPSDTIGPDLRADVANDLPKVLLENKGVAAQGTISGGPFEIPGTVAREMLVAPTNPNGLRNSEVVRQWRNGDDLSDRPADWWIIDFGNDRTEVEAALFELPFISLRNAWDEAQEARRRAKKRLLRAGEPKTAASWWILQRRRGDLLRDLAARKRFLATSRVAKHRFFVWLDNMIVPDTRLVVFRRDDDLFLGVLQSKIHEVWSLRFGGSHGVGNDPEYVHTAIFETFPFPKGLTPDIPVADYVEDPRAKAIATAAARLNELRENWLNPADLVVREPEVVPGYPDRLLPKDEEAAKDLKRRTLTNLYNARPQWLEDAHATLDEAVAEAYGWGDDWRAGALTDDEILRRLFELNQERANAG